MRAWRSNCERRLPASFVWVIHIHGRSVGTPESVDEGGVVPEMMFKRSPLRNNKTFHGGAVTR
jgi:hypothetical protein